MTSFRSPILILCCCLSLRSYGVTVAPPSAVSGDRNLATPYVQPANDSDQVYDDIGKGSSYTPPVTRFQSFDQQYGTIANDISCSDEVRKKIESGMTKLAACSGRCENAKICESGPSEWRRGGGGPQPLARGTSAGQTPRAARQASPGADQSTQAPARSPAATQKNQAGDSGNQSPKKGESEQSTPTAASNDSSPSGNINADFATCNQLARAAIECCNNPSTCTDPAELNSGSGVKDSCSAMQSSGLNDASGSQSAINACFQRFTACSETCNSFASNYADNASQFTSTAANCRSLSSRIKSMNENSSNSLSAAKAGNNCSGMSSAQPQNASGSDKPQSKSDPFGCQQNPSSQSCQQCSANANSAACQSALAAQGKPTELGQAGFGTPANNNKGAFNLADNSDTSLSPLSYGGGQGGAPPQVKPISNNSGGGIPGAGGGGGGASLGGAGGKRGGGGGPAASGQVTDIDQGFRSGGYSQTGGAGGGGAGLDTSGAESFGKRGPASAGGLDLKQYLPGGARDPKAGFGAGGLRPPGTEIHGKHVDMWARITDRMREKCKIGELYGCD